VISYAPNFEDVLLNRVFGQDSGYYIDIGAMDPVEGSVTKAFYDRGWSGINVEPDGRFYAKLVAERQRDINLNIAVGEAEEVRSFYAFEAQGISTFRESFRDYFLEREFPCTKVSCSLTTLALICEEYVSCPVDFLKIDAEGWEGPILRGGDWRKFRPVVLVIEATEPYSHTPAWTDWEPFLTEACHYNFVYFDGVNRFYVRAESRDLESRFAYPPNVLDNFQTYPLVLAERRAAEARARADQLELAFASAQRDLESRLEQSRGSLRRQGTLLKSVSTEKQRLVNAVQVLQGEIDIARSQIASLQQELGDSRFWVGRLSEKLAANSIEVTRNGSLP
jgi:FkbM family methyltransferase